MGGRPTGDGEILVEDLPQPHGDHFHLGDAVVRSRDATGLANAAAWAALERKGLIKSRFPHAAVLTPAGLAYDTGLADAILHRGGPLSGERLPGELRQRRNRCDVAVRDRRGQLFGIGPLARARA